MNKNISCIDLGTKDYKETWDYQESVFDKVMQSKKNGDPTSNFFILVEHPHVFTLGKNGSDRNLLVTEQWLKMAGASFYKINRGGDITYHGPGQIVGYPIIDLENFGLGIHDYIFNLEEVIIRTLTDYSVICERLEGSTGVWLDTNNELTVRKICAIGVKASRYITMHGFALNVNPDLNYFQKIIPCGIPDKKVTSLEKELGKTIDMHQVKERIKHHFSDVFKAILDY